MKLQLVSDLHLEFLEQDFPRERLVAPAPEADLLVLAGDIHAGIRAVAAFRDWPVPVLYLAGNHEFYGRDWEQTRAALRDACAGTQVVYLDNDVVEFNGTRFLGCTLWTDFLLHGFTRDEWMRAVDTSLSDRLVRTRTGPLRSRQTLEDHERSRCWLECELSKPFPGKTVVITHHGPHPSSIHPRYAGHRLNAGFVSDLTPLLGRVDLWLHGHVHDSAAYQVGRCRVVANPAGYLLNRSTATTSADFQFENPAFDPNLVLHLSA